MKRRSFRALIMLTAIGSAIAVTVFGLILEFSFAKIMLFMLLFPGGAVVGGLLGWKLYGDYWRKQGYEW